MKCLFSIAIISLLIVSSLQINISIARGDKLFNKNTPIVLNLATPDTLEKKSSVDLLCVIDVSGSMGGQKIELVKESLKTLLGMMDSSDRLGLILFNQHGTLLADLTPVTTSNKIDLLTKIDSIRANGGTSILSGLEIAVDILTKSHDLTVTSGVILLSDGQDNNLSDKELADGLKQLTKGKNLSFTLHTFGYGKDHDPLIMNKLAHIRDGSFYFVDELSKVKPYFVNVLGGCMSVISNQIKVTVKSTFKIVKVFGLEDLFTYKIEDNFFETDLLQFISGKDYTYVLELEIPEETSYGIELLDVEVKYTDMKGEVHSQKDKYMYNHLKNTNTVKEVIQKANEEYIRSVTYDTIQQALNEREKGQKEEAKTKLNNMENWLKNNYSGKSTYVEDVQKSKTFVEKEEEYEHYGKAFMASRISEGQLKRGGMQMEYSNSIQNMMVSKI